MAALTPGCDVEAVVDLPMPERVLLGVLLLEVLVGIASGGEVVG